MRTIWRFFFSHFISHFPFLVFFLRWKMDYFEAVGQMAVAGWVTVSPLSQLSALTTKS